MAAQPPPPRCRQPGSTHRAARPGDRHPGSGLSQRQDTSEIHIESVASPWRRGDSASDWSHPATSTYQYSLSHRKTGSDVAESVSVSYSLCHSSSKFAPSHRISKRRSRSLSKWLLWKPRLAHNANLLLVLICLLVVHVVTVTAQNPTWRDPPKNASNHLDETVTLKCGVDNLDDKKIMWKMYHDDSSDILFIDDESWVLDDWPSKDRYSVSPHPVRTGYGYDLTIRNIERSDDQAFECAVSQATLKQKAWLTVLGEYSASSSNLLNYSSFHYSNYFDYIQ